jgi:ANTH domain
MMFHSRVVSVLLVSVLLPGLLVDSVLGKSSPSSRRSAAAVSSRRQGGRTSGSPPTSRVNVGRSSRSSNGVPPSSTQRRRQALDDDEDAESTPVEDDDDDDDDDEGDLGFLDLGGSEEEDDEEPPRRSIPPPRRPATGSARTARETALHRSSRRRPPQQQPQPRRPVLEDDDDEDEMEPNFRRPPPSSSRRPPPGSQRPLARNNAAAAGYPGRGGPPPRGGRPGPGARAGTVVPYGQQPRSAYAGAFTRGLSLIRESMPDPAAVREAALQSIQAARETTSNLSTNLYRDIKGLTSSELEQVMLKATRPDDSGVKGKHVERLVGVTYQISARYDIYDAVLRKLWSKMAERDWRTTIKALYILHRFSADGSPDHAPALKARLRELRRTRDPKRKDKYFNSKQLLAGDVTPENKAYRAFLARYSSYVLLRAQCFGGLFDEISQEKVDKKKPPQQQKPVTATNLRPEHLDAAVLLLKAGVACQLREGEECEHTAIAVERVVADLMGLCSAVATALNKSLKPLPDLRGADPSVLRKWCEFYKELVPQTKVMIKKSTPKLDAYGLFLPSRMGTSVAPDLLQKGLDLKDEKEDDDNENAEPESETAPKDGDAQKDEDDDNDEEEEDEEEPPADKKTDDKKDKEAIEEEDDLEDEYEYEEEEYYEDEEE